MMVQTLAELIDALGGPEAAAAALSQRAGRKIGAKAVYKWRDRGTLPARWILPAHDECIERGIDVSVKTLGRLSIAKAAA